ncbi:MAG: DUF4124 domain-containing protein [Deltaproteobacteria bacterium]
MKRHALLLALAILFCGTLSYADFYRWVDKEGVTHITDDLNRVPNEYRDALIVHEKKEIGPKEKAVEPQSTDSGPKTEQKTVELYGDYTLDWWKQAFSNKRGEIARLEEKVSVKKQFMEVFEGGRRFGQVFGQSEVDAYNRYKTEIPNDELALQDLKDVLSELVRKATNAGVPRDVRGE